MFKPVPSKPDLSRQEEETLQFWQREDTFEALRRRNLGGPRFSFMDGPITANNPMGVHHAWGRTIKDVVQRYQAMLGKDQRYQNGFDCQGLWVEVEVEKELGFNSKRQIENMGLDQFSRKCRERVERYAAMITKQSQRLGQWMDWDHSYYTMTDNNIEHIWHFLATCQKRGWLYRGHRVMPWCVRCGTSLSQHELVGADSYQEMTHTAAFIQLPVVGQPGLHFLVWTTTPWTLSANVALAVHPELEYAFVEQQGKTFILSSRLAGRLLPQGRRVKTVKGQELLGWKYEGPFEQFPARSRANRIVIPWEEVGEEEGTGIVHIAPGCGAEDYELSKPHGLAVIAPLDENGDYFPGFGFLSGRNVKDVAPEIFQDLREHGYFFATELFSHRYPICWRCHQELVFRAVDEWFISSNEVRPALLRAAAQVHWCPDSAGKRMEDWLSNMGDWCISRKRFWGLPLPFYSCSQCGTLTVVGSVAELEALSGESPLPVPELHRPWIDEVKIHCPQCGATVERVPEVGDCWLDAGIVPYSTLNYLHDRSYWETWFPADFITEMREQIRLWFYSMLFMSVVLEGRPPYQRALVYEKLMDEKGEPMHRSRGNAIWFDEAIERMGADVMRWLYLSQPIESNLLFGYGPAEDVMRRMLLLWNVYSFFVTYANIDGFDPMAHHSEPARRSFADRWILSRLEGLVVSCREALDRFDGARVTTLVENFVDDLSTWWLRRSRRRFWKSEEDQDKADAYMTLYEALVTLSRLIAPLVPFLAESLYQNLVCSVDPKAPPSVHLSPYPEARQSLISETINQEMDLVKELISLGRSARSKVNLKVRQPLAEMVVVGLREEEKTVVRELSEFILEELNIKQLLFADKAEELQEIRLLPNLPLLGPRFGKQLPRIRQALQSIDGETALAAFAAGVPLHVELDDFSIQLNAADVIVQRHDRTGFAAEGSGRLLVALDTEISEDLRLEGMARELAHAIQNQRKEAGFQVDDHIRIYHQEDPAWKRVWETFSDYLKRETLCEELFSCIPDGFQGRELLLEGKPICFYLERVSG
jgi:isoleucyl-tRNA synthetase